MVFDAIRRLFTDRVAGRTVAVADPQPPRAPDPMRSYASMLIRENLLLGNAMAYDRLDPETVRRLPEYRRVADVATLLRTFRVEGTEFVRLGGDADGAYVMLDSLRPPSVNAGYSLGIGDEVSWDVAVGERGVELVLLDHTVEGPPRPVPGGRFVKQGIRGAESVPGCVTLAEAIAADGYGGRTDLVLKMDVEGAEWAVLDEVSSGTLGQFVQIVIEFHRLRKVTQPEVHSMVTRCLRKVLATHAPLHVHGNNAHLPLWIGDLVLPDVVEVTFARRADHAGRLVPRDESFPTDLDRPNLPHLPDVFLGWTFTGGVPGTPAASSGPAG